MAAVDAAPTSFARPVSQPAERVAARNKAPFVSVVRQLSLADTYARSRSSQGLVYLPVCIGRRIVCGTYGYMKYPLFVCPKEHGVVSLGSFVLWADEMHITANTVQMRAIPFLIYTESQTVHLPYLLEGSDFTI